MKSTSDAPSGIVPQVLTKDNYDRWKAIMQNYLQGQDLWDVLVQSAEVETVTNPCNHLSPQNVTDQSNVTPDIEQGLSGVVNIVETEASWKMKDAKALHIIQLSCGRVILNEISHFKTAKSAWNHLSKQYGNQLKACGDTEHAILGDSHGQQNKEKLFRMVRRGNYIGNIIEAQHIEIWITSASGRTLLHDAVIDGHEENVGYLVNEGKEALMGMPDKRGYTALALAARYTGNTDIAKRMVEHEDGKFLLTVQNNNVEIPVLLAAANGHKEMATYLYSVTEEVFRSTETTNAQKEKDARNRVLLLPLCITAEIFDVALRLLKDYPDLPKDSLCINKFSALEALVKMPSAFPSGTQFGRLEKTIYNMLSVDREFGDNYKIDDIADVVLSVTSFATIADKRRQKTPSVGRQVLNFLLLVMYSGWLCLKQPVKILGACWFCIKLPLKILGLLLLYLFVPIFKWLNIFGIKELYDQKYTHYEVLRILKYFCESIEKFGDRQLIEASAYGAMLHAAQHGIIEFINAMRAANPDLLSAVDNCHRGIFSYAILNRKQNVFQLIHSLHGHGRKEIFRYHIDTFGNNLLHLAAYLGPSSDRDSKAGAALQMQGEIQWFKAVEKVVCPMYKETKNSDGKKPYELFTEDHDELVKAGEKWAKETATSFTIVGTLIITIMFAAAFTVPGGNNQETGIPIFLHDKNHRMFITFLVADAMSLFTSATSVLIFIGILTSRYAEKDFLKSLPWKLCFGLFFLFLSVCSMIVAFCATTIMIFKGYQPHKPHKWFVLGAIMSLGSVPIIVLVWLQLRIMCEILHSTWKNPISSIKKLRRS